MEHKSQTITTLHQLLDYDARKFIIAEIQLKNILPEWISKASSIKLKTILQKYLDFIQQHIRKMDSFFDQEEISLQNLTNPIMEVFIQELAEKVSNCADGKIKDACLLACIQGINHYKISTYGTAASFAKALGMENQVAVFREMEVNEKQVDDRLSQLAEYEINVKAKIAIQSPDNISG